MSPYATAGTFLSRIHSAGSSRADWGTLSYVADVPSGTSLGLEVRTGDTPTPDGSWTSFATTALGGDIASSGRYLQYRVTATSTTGDSTPTLQSVTLPYGSVVDTDPPGVTGRTPSSGATAVPVSANVTVTFDEPMDPASITHLDHHPSRRRLGYRCAGHGDLHRLDGHPRPLGRPDQRHGLHRHRRRVGRGRCRQPAGRHRHVDVHDRSPRRPSIAPARSSATTPGTTQTADPGDYELGVKFRSEVAGYITGIRFYKHAGATGTHVAHLWTAAGVQLAEATFTAETASGWQEVDLASPVAIAAGTTYIASYTWPGGYYAYQGGAFTAAGVTDAPLTALQHGVEGPNGVYNETPGAFPTAGNGANYWVDVVFQGTDSVPPTITGRSPANGATGIGTDTNVVVTFSEGIAAGSVTSSSVRLRADDAASDVAATLAVAGATVTLDPSADLAAYTSYTATVTTAVTDSFGNPLAATSTWSFTTGGITTGFIDTTVADFGLGTPGAGTSITDTSGGELTLAPTIGAEFSGSSLPSGWSVKGTPWVTDGTASVAGGNLSVDGTMAATTTTFGPGRSLEFAATFAAQLNQHAGFVADLGFGSPWAIISTAASGDGVYARTPMAARSRSARFPRGESSLPDRLDRERLRLLRRWRPRDVAPVRHRRPDAVWCQRYRPRLTPRRRLGPDVAIRVVGHLRVARLRCRRVQRLDHPDRHHDDAGRHVGQLRDPDRCHDGHGRRLVVRLAGRGRHRDRQPERSLRPVPGHPVDLGLESDTGRRARATLGPDPAAERPRGQRPVGHDGRGHGHGDQPDGQRCRRRQPDLDHRRRAAPRQPERDGPGPHLYPRRRLRRPGQRHLPGQRRDHRFDTATVSITVSPVNDAPVCVDGSRTTTEDTALASSVTCSDVDLDARTYAVVDSPLHGSLSAIASDGSFTYTPAADYAGTDSFTFRANDGTVDSDHRDHLDHRRPRSTMPRLRRR